MGVVNKDKYRKTILNLKMARFLFSVFSTLFALFSVCSIVASLNYFLQIEGALLDYFHLLVTAIAFIGVAVGTYFIARLFFRKFRKYQLFLSLIDRGEVERGRFYVLHKYEGYKSASDGGGNYYLLRTVDLDTNERKDFKTFPDIFASIEEHKTYFIEYLNDYEYLLHIEKSVGDVDFRR